MQASFGEYAQVYEENGRNNTNAQLSLGAITLSMTPDMNGHYSFMSLNTGKLVSRKQFTLLPITEEVNRRVGSSAESTCDHRGMSTFRMGSQPRSGKYGSGTRI